MTRRQELAIDAVDKILDNLKGRKGFKHLLEEIELNTPDIYLEIKEELEKIVLEAIPL